jgi:hypothetical protein
VSGTDLDYSLLAGDDLLADIGVARIPVSSQAEAQAVVDKIINYEKHPVVWPWPSGNFYRRVALAGYFECCAGEKDGTEPLFAKFIQTLEQIRGTLVSQGYAADRLYYSDTSYLPSYTGDPTPRYFFDGTDLPPDIGPDSGFPWNADFVDIIDTLIDGRFLVIHRDHGAPWGWKHPFFHKSDAAAFLTNFDNMLPVLFSVNCATGYFDKETVEAAIAAISDPAQREAASEAEEKYADLGDGFLEVLLGFPGRGVVGALGATRSTPTFPNDALAKGFADALFPDVLPDYGDATSITRLADIMNHGKSYVYSQVWGAPQCQDPAQGAGRQCSRYNLSGDEAILYHAFGDPTLEVWTARPRLLAKDFALERLSDRAFVSYAAEQAIITARQGQIPIGRGVVVNGRAELEYVVPPDPALPIEVSASKPGFVSAALMNCFPTLEAPALVSHGSLVEQGGDGRWYTRYLLEVTNRDVYPDEMFTPAPELPPCGSNTESSRTWVDVFDDQGQRRYGFCALTSSDGLKNVWFSVLQGAPAPRGAYVQIVDRACGTTYVSNTVTLEPPD